MNTDSKRLILKEKFVKALMECYKAMLVYNQLQLFKSVPRDLESPSIKEIIKNMRQKVLFILKKDFSLIFQHRTLLEQCKTLKNV